MEKPMKITKLRLKTRKEMRETVRAELSKYIGKEELL